MIDYLSKVPINPDLPHAEGVRQQREEQSMVDSAEPLTSEELDEKEGLLEKVNIFSTTFKFESELNIICKKDNLKSYTFIAGIY